MKKIFTLLFFAIVGLNNINAATFSSVASGTWSAPATWTITSGTDADGIPDSGDDVTINAGHTVDLVTVSNFVKIFLNNGVLKGNSKRFNVYGNFTNNGPVSGILLYIQAPCIFTSAPSFNGAITWFIYSNLTISAGTSIITNNTMLVDYGKSVSNLGNATIGGGINLNGTWTNGVNSTLAVSNNIASTGLLNCSATSNTVTYSSSNCKQIKNATYYDLKINAATSVTRTAQGNIDVLNNFTLAGTSISSDFNLGGFNLTVGGNWLNSVNRTILNQGTIAFNTSGTQTITRSSSEVINNMVVSGTGTTLLGRSVNVINLTVNSGIFDVSASNFTVNLSGNLINNGTINPRLGTFNLNGSTAQTMSGTTNTQFYNITLNNAAGLTINSTQSLSNALTVTNGDFDSNGNFILISDATATARIAPVGAGGSFSNSMIIQKHISARPKGWHDLSSTTQNSTIFDWDDEMYMSGFSTVDSPSGIAGVDGSAGGFKSVYTYDEPTSTYIAVTSSLTALEAGKGYEIWFADNTVSWNAKTIDTRGVPNFGTQVIGLSYSAGAGIYAGVNLVGNPFASPIDYSLVSKINAPGSILMLDNSGNYVDFGTDAIIPTHQGFWVTATGAGASISIPESSKAADNTTSFNRKAPNYGIKLVYSSPNLPYYNENTINFIANATLGFDYEFDAPFIKSPNLDAPYIALKNSANEKLITNAINDDADEVTIDLELYSPLGGIYYIQPSMLNIGNYNYAWIENIKTGKKHELTESISINSEKEETNTDFVLRLSKESNNSTISQSVFENDITVFNIENSLNIKSYNSKHVLTMISIIDLSGKLVIEQTNTTLTPGLVEQVDISNLAKGLYIVQITDELNNTTSKKIIR